jgi:Domain of unknown function (DUF4169)
MADIVNLRRFKRAKAKDERATIADANRLKFGQSKTEKQLVQKQDALEKNKLDGHKRDDR